MKLNVYQLDSDFTSQKERASLDLDLTFGGAWFAPNSEQTYSVGQDVPPGVYFENVSWKTSLTGDTRVSASLLDYQPADYMYDITFVLTQVSNTRYELRARVYNMDTNWRFIDGFTANVKAHLSVSPFN
jgi:hypothetical protein